MNFCFVWCARCAALVGLLTFAANASAQPFTLQGPGLDPDDFEITTFAEGLNYPVGMVQLDDGSILTAVSNGSSFFGSSRGSIIRLADTDGNGVSDVQQTLFSNVGGGKLSSIKRAGDIIAVTGQGKTVPISFYRLGAQPSDPLTSLGTLQLNYPSGGWLHPHSSLELREKPGAAGRYELYFQLGSDTNFNVTTKTVGLGGTLGITSTLVGDALHRVELSDDSGMITATSHDVVATGLRNATGLAFHPITGDLYIGDNGIDGVSNPNEPTSPDEINVLPAADLYGAAEDFGFPGTYQEYRTEVEIGSSGILPIVNFQPLPAPNGEEAEGVNEIAFVPPMFPEPLAGGLVAGFHGKFSLGGLANEENAVAFVDLDDNSFFHLISNDESAIGHLDGLLSTTDTLYLSDISPGGAFGTGTANTGKIYAIKAVGTAGDYNGNGVVDAADYTVWRDSLGDTGMGLAADGNGDMEVNLADYIVWKQAFAPSDSGAGQTVPEPTTIVLLAMLMAPSFTARCRGRRICS